MTVITLIEANPELPKTIPFYDSRKFRVVNKRLTVGRLERAADDLDAAAKLLKAEVWTTGSWCDHSGRMCAQGAIAKAATNDPHGYHEERAQFAIKIADSVAFTKYSLDAEDGGGYGEPIGDILDFNDSLSKSPQFREKHSAKVRKALRTAAKAARARAEELRARHS